MTAALYFQGHVYVDAGEFPCPIPGCEDGLVATRTDEGVPAWWDAGHLYVFNAEKSVDLSGMNGLPNLYSTLEMSDVIG